MHGWTNLDDEWGPPRGNKGIYFSGTRETGSTAILNNKTQLAWKIERKWTFREALLSM